MAQPQHGNAATRQQWTAAQLVDALRAWDVAYLTLGRRTEQAAQDEVTKRLPATTLIRTLSRSDEPRVRDAFIGLLLLHPEIATDVIRVVAEARAAGEDELAEQVITLALAALYLQRIWWFEWALAYGVPPQLDEALFRQWRLRRGLPAPDVGYGEPGLRRLTIYQRQRMGKPVNIADDWQNQAQHTLNQGWSRRLAEPKSLRQRSALDWRAFLQMLRDEQSE